MKMLAACSLAAALLCGCSKSNPHPDPTQAVAASNYLAQIDARLALLKKRGADRYEEVSRKVRSGEAGPEEAQKALDEFKADEREKAELEMRRSEFLSRYHAQENR